MAIKDNLKSNFNIHAEIESYLVADGVTVGRGDPLKIVTQNGTDCVTNVIENEESVDAVAINTGSSGDKIQCYIFIYREQYKNLVGLPYVLLSQFTYKELRRLHIQNHISTSSNSVGKIPCNVLSKYTCNNLNTYGVRMN